MASTHPSIKHIIVISSLIAYCYCSPIKRRNDCIGTACVVDLNPPTEVIFPDYFTNAVMSALPSIVGTQDQIVSLHHNQSVNQIEASQSQQASLNEIVNSLGAILHNQQDMQETTNQRLQNMTDVFENMVALLQSQVSILQGRLPIHTRDCTDIASQGPFSTGLYTIQPWDNLGSITVYCDMDTNGGGWTVIQRRYDGTVDFYLGWTAYESGFGTSDGEHWVGLRNIHRLTRIGTWELLIELEDFNGSTAYAHYVSFQVGDAASYYRLSIGAYDGDAGDSLVTHNNKPFTTKDRDHDDHASLNCAVTRKGAGWYKSCAYANLNGLYLGPNHVTNTGMTWHHWKSNREVLKKSSMKIRRIL